MRTRTLLIAAAAGLGGLSTWVAVGLLSGEAPDGAPAPSRTRSQRPPHASPLALEPARAAESAETAAGAEIEREVDVRSAEIVHSDVDTLRAVRGIVLDHETGAPVAGIGLSFLSRRPRTITVVTDEQGRFQTGPELACGAVSVLHAPDEQHLDFRARRELDPVQFVLTPRPAAGLPDPVREVVLRARAPERVLEVGVRLPDGQPAAGAAVALSWGDRGPAGEFVPLGRDFEESDAEGRARFPLFGPDVYARSLRIEGEHGGMLSSEIVELDPPLALQTLSLPLHPGAVLRARAVNDEGRPVAGVSLYLSVQADARAVRGRSGETDASGEGLFTGLRSGCYTVSAVHPRTGQRVERTFDLVRGEHQVTVLELSVAGLRPAVTGTVLDEYGYPLPGEPVTITSASGECVRLASGDKGHFEYWARPQAELLVRVGEGIASDRFEPQEIAVPFGTRDVVLRRAECFEVRTLAFEIVGRADEAGLAGARVALVRGSAEEPAASEVEVFEARHGVVQVSFKRLPDLAWVVTAPGHVGQRGRVAELYRRDPVRALVRIALEPGFERALVLRDRLSRRPLAGVEAILLGRATAKSDAEGRLTLSGAQWPATVRFEAAGYRALDWDPLARGFPSDVVWLDALR